jgi:hypothetical protein
MIRLVAAQVDAAALASASIGSCVKSPSGSRESPDAERADRKPSRTEDVARTGKTLG